MTPQEATEALFQAARSGNLNDAKAALDAGADPTARDDEQMTPLHWAVVGGDTDLARLLIEKGADPAARDDQQWTPLHLAAWGRCTEFVKLLEDAAKDKPSHSGRVAKLRDSGEPQIG